MSQGTDYLVVTRAMGKEPTENRLNWGGKRDIYLAEEGSHIPGEPVTESEATFLTGLVIATQPAVIAEVGCGRGRALCALIAGAAAVGHLVGEMPEVWSCDINPDAVAECQEKFPGAATIVHGDVEALLNAMPTPPLLAFIDGDHTLPGVTRDFEALSDAMPSGSLIVLHDSGCVLHVQRFCQNIGALCLSTCKGIALWRKP